MTDSIVKSENIGRQRELRQYLVGAVVTVALTGLAFLAVWSAVFGPLGTKIAVAVLALAQIAAHFRYFLHIDLAKSHRDDLMLILFTVLIIVLMVGGTIWILFDQWARMM